MSDEGEGEEGGENIVVLDNSSYKLKVGLVDDEVPQGIFTPFVAKDGTIGDDAVKKWDEMDVNSPFQRGLVTNWDDMEKVWNYAFTKKLNLATMKEHSVLVSEHPLNPKINREKTVSILFEKFQVPALFLQMQPVLSVYGSGKSSGLVVESGESMTNIMPVFNGIPLHSSRLKRLDIGGGDLCEYLIKLIDEQGLYDLKTKGQRWAIHNLQDKSCYVALDYQQELKKAQDDEYDDDDDAGSSSSASTQQYKMPDGKMINIGALKFKVPESLFQPKSLLGVEEEGLHIMVAKCISGCEVDIRKTFYENIVLAGGVSMFPGFRERLEKELKELIPSTVKFAINDQTDRNLSAWIGGAILASLPQFPNVCITREEYAETGAEIVHEKCPR